MSTTDMDATSATSGSKDANEQPDATSLGKGAHPEVAKDQTLGVNNPTGDGNASAQNSKALPNTEPPKLLVSHANPDQLKVGEEQNVATRFYSLSPAAICEIAFKGLDSLRDKFKMTWIQADISGSLIVDDLMVSTLDQTLRELEASSKIVIPFSFQRIKIMQNIVAAIHSDHSLEEAVREGWANDFGIYSDTLAPQIQTPVARKSATPIYEQTSEAASHTPDANQQNSATSATIGKSEPISTTLFHDEKKDFRAEVRSLRDTMDPPTLTSEKGTLVAKLSDGTEIYAPNKNQDRAPQILNYPTLEDYTSELWDAFIVDFRRIDIRARPRYQCHNASVRISSENFVMIRV